MNQGTTRVARRSVPTVAAALVTLSVLAGAALTPQPAAEADDADAGPLCTGVVCWYDPDGDAGLFACVEPVPLAQLDQLPAGSRACVEHVTVNAVSDTQRGRFAVTDGAVDVPVHISRGWWQHGSPTVGMDVAVEGTVARDGDGLTRLDPVTRWFDYAHDGPTVSAGDVAAGRVEEGTYVWVERATVGPSWRNEGDGDEHVEVGTACPFAHLTTEFTPPYRAFVTPPAMGQTVTLFGAVRYDPGHGWWEIHPVRAWHSLGPAAVAEECPSAEQEVPPPGVIPDKIPPVGGTPR